MSAELLVTKQEESAVRQGPSLLEALCHFYRAIRFLNKGVRLSNLFPEAFSRGDKQLPTQERYRATKGYRDLGIPAGKSLYGHCTPPSALCTQSANRQGEEEERRKETTSQELVKNSL